MRIPTFAYTLVMLLTFLTTSAQAKTVIDLIDVSGSISTCNTAFCKNLQVIHDQVDTLDKNDRILIYTYASHDRPNLMVDFTFPDKRGGKNRKIIAARNDLRKEIKKGLAKALSADAKKLAGEGTDCIGALNYMLLVIGDMRPQNLPVQINHFSDGIQTTGIGSFNPKKYKKYLHLLENKLARSALGKPTPVSEIVWHGSICYEPSALNLSQATYLKAQIRTNWTDFIMRELPGVQLSYFLDY